MKQFITFIILYILFFINCNSVDAIFTKKDEYLFINEQGKKANIQYKDYITLPQGDYFIIYWENKKIGYKDKDEKNIVIKAQFDDVRSIIFEKDYMPVANNSKWGMIDRKGNWLIPPKYDILLNYSENLIGACINGKCGYLDKDEKWIIPPTNIKFLCSIDTQELCNSNSDFNDGYAAVIIKEQWNAVISKKGKDKYYPAVVPKNFKKEDIFYYGKIKNGNFYIKGSKKDIGCDVQNDYIKADDVYKKYSIGYINKQGKLVLKENENYLGYFSNGLAVAYNLKKGKYGYIDKQGKWVIKPQYKFAKPFNQKGYAEVYKK